METKAKSKQSKSPKSLSPSRPARTLALPDATEPWERRASESDRDWGFFILYRDLHPSVRSIAKAFALYQEQQNGKTSVAALAYKAPSWFELIATKNQWTARARAFDEWRDRDQIERLQSTRVRFLVETAEVGREMRQKASEALAVLRVVAYEQTIDENGDVVTVATSTLGPAAITQLIKAGAELERSAIGLEPAGASGGVNVQIANIVGSGVGGQLPIPVSDQELMAKVLEVARAQRQGQGHPLLIEGDTAPSPHRHDPPAGSAPGEGAKK